MLIKNCDAVDKDEHLNNYDSCQPRLIINANDVSLPIMRFVVSMPEIIDFGHSNSCILPVPTRAIERYSKKQCKKRKIHIGEIHLKNRKNTNYQWVERIQGVKVLVAKLHPGADILPKNVTDSYVFGKL